MTICNLSLYKIKIVSIIKILVIPCHFLRIKGIQQQLKTENDQESF